MNDTLKAAGHIGAELAAAKADLQREMERHRKTWRQLEQAQRERIDPFSVAEAIRKALDRNSCPNVFLVIAYEAAIEALSQQAEAAKPVYPPKDTWPEWANWCGLDPSGYWVFYEREPVTSDVGRTPSGGSWGKPVLDEPQPCWQVMLYPRNAGKQAEPAPAQDELNDGIINEITYNTLGQWPSFEAQSWACKVVHAVMAARPAQTEQQPFGWVTEDYLTDKSATTYDQVVADRWRAKGWPVSEIYAAPIAQTAPQGKFRMGDMVKKSTGSEWEGRVVGWYSTEQTKEGYAVESSAHRNSVQIYPAKALELVQMDAKEA